jgi:hypothetical protein
LTSEKVAVLLVKIVFVPLEKIVNQVIHLRKVCVQLVRLNQMLRAFDQVAFINFPQAVQVSLLVFGDTQLILEIFCVATKQTLPLVVVNTFTVLVMAIWNAQIYHVKRGTLETVEVPATSDTGNARTLLLASETFVLGIFF